MIKKSGRKKPRPQDCDIEIEPAPDSKLKSEKVNSEIDYADIRVTEASSSSSPIVVDKISKIEKKYSLKIHVIV